LRKRVIDAPFLSLLLTASLLALPLHLLPPVHSSTLPPNSLPSETKVARQKSLLLKKSNGKDKIPT
jgi:hypothetical protein